MNQSRNRKIAAFNTQPSGRGTEAALMEITAPNLLRQCRGIPIADVAHIGDDFRKGRYAGSANGTISQRKIHCPRMATPQSIPSPIRICQRLVSRDTSPDISFADSYRSAGILGTIYGAIFPFHAQLYTPPPFPHQKLIEANTTKLSHTQLEGKGKLPTKRLNASNQIS